MASAQGSPQGDKGFSPSSTEVIRHDVLQKGFADVIVVLTSAVPIRVGKASAAAAGRTSGLGAIPKFESLTSSLARTLPADLLACFESAYDESVSDSGVNLARRSAPGKNQPQFPLAEQVAPVQYLENLGIVLGSIGATGLRGLQQHPLVKSFMPVRDLSLVQPNHISSTPPPEAGFAWGLERMNIPYLWEQGFDGTGIRIGHLDTGADGTHPALRGAFAAFWESNNIGRPLEVCPEPHDTGIHGTHTAGTLVGRSVNGFRMGVAPGAMLASGIVIEGGKANFRILGGLNWVLGQDVRVLSMSFGIPGVAEEFLGITKTLRERRVLLAVAIGNDGPDTSRSPGNYARVMSVGAMDSSNQMAEFSSSEIFGDRIVPDLVAPGVNIISCVPGNKYAAMDGSSMSAPHVAGLAALLFQAKPNATVELIQEVIYSSCKRPSSMVKERANRGVPDGKLALKQLLAG